MNDPVYLKPRNGKEMMYAIKEGNGRGGPIPICMYSDICRNVEKYGAVRTLQLLNKMGERVLILLQDPLNMRTGHWMSLSFYPLDKTIYFFSSYGGKPDEEKNRWIDVAARFSSGQARNALNDGLKELHKLGWTIHYNDYPFQKEGDNSATCGIWTAAFLNLGLNPDDFYKYVKKSHLTYKDFYNAFFKRTRKTY